MQVTTTDSPLARMAPAMLSLLRVVAGLCFLEHGCQKILGFPAGMSPAVFSVFWFAGIIELVGGILMILGLFTRPAALIMSGEMAFAYFMAHFPKSFFPALNGGDAAILFCFIFLFVFFAGPGPYSLDAKRGAKAL